MYKELQQVNKKKDKLKMKKKKCLPKLYPTHTKKQAFHAERVHIIVILWLNLSHHQGNTNNDLLFF